MANCDTDKSSLSTAAKSDAGTARDAAGDGFAVHEKRRDHEDEDGVDPGILIQAGKGQGEMVGVGRRRDIHGVFDVRFRNQAGAQFFLVSSENLASASPLPTHSSMAIMPGPPALAMIPTFGPAGTGCVASA